MRDREQVEVELEAALAAALQYHHWHLKAAERLSAKIDFYRAELAAIKQKENEG